MKNVLLVIDMQNDFIDGALGTAEAIAIVDKVKKKIEKFGGAVYYTRDTHPESYLETREGKHLPVPHCIKGSKGWQISEKLQGLRCDGIIDKPTFGSTELQDLLRKEAPENITLVGLCTDICVISNAMLLKAALPEANITVDAECCAGVTPESHKRALLAMQMCQIQIENM
ncbi:MAG: cysteine hydrolase [Ruminococcaceae bacterium]|nr:cysteine hydrolase [Oscillospiraceae bacterium]